ncbi:C40 family peptidase [Desulfosarcina cetonica]|uniref:C40 family peptidase n=1 Tax=Desulfosarcina cetonica TaxID=90730 RepID=UPI0006D1ACD3|nr:C40 family peptidase [Desulfosarcina cetonica]
MTEGVLNPSGTAFLIPPCLQRRSLLAMFLSFAVAGCATTPANTPCIKAPVCRRAPQVPLASLPGPPQAIPNFQEPTAEAMLREEIQDWLGTPHRLGGLSHRGIDCSGLVMLVYEKLFDLKLPRTSRAMMRVGQRVDRERLSPGDLVFSSPDAERHMWASTWGRTNSCMPPPPTG